MADDLPARIIEAASFVQRKSMCLGGREPGEPIHHGHPEFLKGLSTNFTVGENNMAETVVDLKAELKVADTETFWKRLMQGMTAICSAQYGFVAKRILVDDEDTAVEMPQLGEEGSCLMGVAFYLNDGHSEEQLHRNYKYVAWGAPCAYMRHDKVFLIPDGMSSAFRENPNKFPVEPEAYIAVPLFSEGKCFAHFGMLWTREGLEKRTVSWGYLEMVLHSLEDMIAERLLTGESFREHGESLPKPQMVRPQAHKVISSDMVSPNQSLKPYAKSLSHELRTPMQGVVGMLDVMHATVEDAITSTTSAKMSNIFQSLKENIEIIQDSSKRAVEAADNVVHAYDLNMQIPENPMNGDESPMGVEPYQPHHAFENRPRFLIEGSDIAINPYKRRRSTPLDWSQSPSGAPRAKFLKRSSDTSPRTSDLRSAVEESSRITQASPGKQTKEAVFKAVTNNRPSLPQRSTTSRIPSSLNSEAENNLLMSPSNYRQTNLQNLLNLVIHEALQVGGRPESAIGESTSLGEKIEVRQKHSSGEISTNTIEVTIDPAVPETLFIDERDLAKLVSCVFLNAVKFTEDGKIDIVATLSPKGQYVVITVRDTGKGIPADFLPNIFKPFAREDDSITRSKEGLGLGLLVAKGLSRKIGGDLVCVRSSTTGPDRGSEFAITIPINPAEPSGSPTLTPANRTPTPGSMTGSDFTGRTVPYHTKSNYKDRTVSPNKQISPARSVKAPAVASEQQGSTPRKHQRTNSAASIRAAKKESTFDRKLSEKYPLTFLVAEDNRINRRLLVNMLSKLGYKDVYEAFDGKEAVRVMSEVLASTSLDEVKRQPSAQQFKPVDMILMDLWMPEMDGYEATQRIRQMYQDNYPSYGADGPLGVSADRPTAPTVLAVSADVTDEAMSRAARVGMEGFMTKPYKIPDLQRLIVEYCGRER